MRLSTAATIAAPGTQHSLAFDAATRKEMCPSPKWRLKKLSKQFVLMMFSCFSIRHMQPVFNMQKLSHLASTFATKLEITCNSSRCFAEIFCTWHNCVLTPIIVVLTRNAQQSLPNGEKSMPDASSIDASTFYAIYMVYTLVYFSHSPSLSM